MALAATDLDAFLEAKALSVRQANREMYLRHVLIHFDDQRTDQQLDYVGILRRVQAVVTQELAEFTQEQAQKTPREQDTVS